MNLVLTLVYLQITSDFYHLSKLGPKQLCALAHLGFTPALGTLDYGICKRAGTFISFWVFFQQGRPLFHKEDLSIS